ncbi:MAG: hypothetical protein U5Q44_11950 [Dehalococcoidia bacterium]|nr:hypothetical protein [Dehalococcoidia bacterium]
MSIPVFASREDGRRHVGERGQLVRLFLRNHRAAHIGCRAAAKRTRGVEGIANRVYPMQPEGIFRAMFHHCHEAHDGALERVVFGNVVPELAEQPGAPVAAIHGTQDESAPFGSAAEVAARSGWRLQPVEGATHQLIVNRASVVATWVREEVLHAGRSAMPRLRANACIQLRIEAGRRRGQCAR